MSARYDTDVIVVGAGPIGLATAASLARHGVSFRLFERRRDPAGGSRAHDVLSRSRELLAGVGVREGLDACGYEIQSAFIHLHGRRLAVKDMTGAPGTPGTLFTSQQVVEAALRAAIATASGSVEQGACVEDVAADDQGVTVSVTVDGADPIRLRCRYLVAADGASGCLRKAAGLDFQRQPLAARATRQIDATLHWRRSTQFDQAWFFLYENGFAGVMPIWEGVYRIFFLEDAALMPAREPTLNEMQARARAVIDDTITLTDPVWASYGTFSHGVAPAYSAERVFLEHRTFNQMHIQRL